MFDIVKNYERINPEIVEQFSAVSESASIYEAMGRQGSLGDGIRPVWPGTRLCGCALTVHLRPGDNLILHKAIEMVQPGDVLVVSVDGFHGCGGMWGGLMTASAVSRKCAGLVTDGAVRDTMAIKEMGFPVFSAGINVNGTTKSEPGTINHPVIIQNVLIRPGDLVFGDNDGVVIVPKETAAEAYEKTMEREKAEDELLDRILKGEGIVFNLSGYEKKFRDLNMSEES